MIRRFGCSRKHSGNGLSEAVRDRSPWHIRPRPLHQGASSVGRISITTDGVSRARAAGRFGTTGRRLRPCGYTRSTRKKEGKLTEPVDIRKLRGELAANEADRESARFSPAFMDELRKERDRQIGQWGDEHDRQHTFYD